MINSVEQSSKKFHGIMLIDKPTDCTSHDVVNSIRRTLNCRSVGHAGTLDPLASGLLVLMVGEGTKLSDHLLNGDKGYQVKIRFGWQTDTLDATGETISRQEVVLAPQAIREAAENLIGDLELKPPMYSAVKIKGRKLYQIARKNKQQAEPSLEPIEVPVRKMSFYDLKIEESGADWAKISIKCSKGSYVRSWVDQLGKNLGVGAVVEELRRTWSAPYNIDEALPLAEIQKMDSVLESSGMLEERGTCVDLSDCLPEWERVSVFGRNEVLLCNGQISNWLRQDLMRKFPLGKEAPKGLKVFSEESGKLLALLVWTEGKGYKIRRVFNY